MKIQQHITGFTQTNIRVGQGRAFGRVLTVLKVERSRLSWVEAHKTLKANWLDTLTVKQWEIMINNDVLLFSGDQRGNTLRAARTLLDLVSSSGTAMVVRGSSKDE